MNLPKLLTSDPVDGTAKRVIGVSKNVFEFKSNSADVIWKKQPPLMPFTPYASWKLKDHTGAVFNSFIIIGYLGNGRWCAKCRCGNFVARLHKSILKAHPDNTCPECLHNKNLKRKISLRNCRKDRGPEQG